MKGKKNMVSKLLSDETDLYTENISVFVPVAHLTKTILTGSLVKLAFFQR